MKLDIGDSVYWNDPDDTTGAEHNPLNVYPILYESFEQYEKHVALDTQYDWILNSGSADAATIYSSGDVTVYALAHTNKLWDGDKFLRLDDEVSYYKDLPGNYTNVDFIFHMRDEGSSTYNYVGVENSGGDVFKLGLNGSDIVYQFNAGGNSKHHGNLAGGV